MDTTTEHISLTGADGGVVPTTVVRPTAPGRRPAVVLGLEAYGPNRFGRAVSTRLAEMGYVAVAPDYHRGAGPVDPESYTDFAEVKRHIDALDFRRAALDLLAALGHALERSDVGPDRVAVWGYCTGGTLALLTAELSDRVAAAVLFFPSQLWFPETTPLRPVHPIDLLWAVRCPALFLYGDRDPGLPPARRDELRSRLNSDQRLVLYPGAGHAFTAPGPPLRDDAADRAAWTEASAFLREHLPVEAAVPGRMTNR